MHTELPLRRDPRGNTVENDLEGRRSLRGLRGRGMGPRLEVGRVESCLFPQPRFLNGQGDGRRQKRRSCSVDALCCTREHDFLKTILELSKKSV